MGSRVATLRRGAALVGGLGLAGLAAGVLRRRQVDRTIQRTVDRLESGETAADLPVYRPADLSALPAPIQRYFDHVLEPGTAPVRTVRMCQRGEFRLGGPERPWRPVTARQVVAFRPPGFAWDATIDMGAGLSARVLDAYVDGEGQLRANLLGVLPVASAGPNARMNRAELLRYLAEAVWYPTALLPSAGVTWSAVDDGTAKARVRDGDVSVSADFHVTDGEILRVTSDRYRQEVGATVPWTGRFRDYELRDGRRIPTAASVAWEPAGDSTPYWRGRLAAIEYERA